MNNLISVYMNYKVDRLTEYGVFAYQEDTDFVRYVFREYFKVYVDNYYYGIFHTIEEETSYSDENLKIEFKGIMEEMLDDYREWELQVSNEEYAHNRQVIRDLNEVSYQFVKIDWLDYKDKDDISVKIFDFVAQNEFLKNMIGEKENQLARLVKTTYQTCLKLLDYSDRYYEMKTKLFEQDKSIYFMELSPSIRVLDTYRKSMVHKVYQDERLGQAKIECLIQKLSLTILRNTLKKEKQPTYIMEVGSSIVSRGKIKDEIMDLLDNPLFQQNVVLAVNYNTYVNQKSAFLIDYRFACIQDFLHINDIYQKVENISKEGFFQYLLVSDYRFKDRDFFTGYENSFMKLLLFEEE